MLWILREVVLFWNGNELVVFKKIMMITYIPKTKHMKMKKSVDLSSIQKGYDFNI